MAKKLEIYDLKNETIPASSCRSRMKIGGFEVHHPMCWPDWGAGWYLDNNGVIQVGLTYKNNICAISSVGFSGGCDAEASLTSQDYDQIRDLRGGDPDEVRSTHGREGLKWRHERILERLDDAQAAVDQAMAAGVEDGVRLVEIARRAYGI